MTAPAGPDGRTLAGSGAEAAKVQPIKSDEDVVRVRQLVRTLAVTARLSLVDQTKLVTAASELARNTLVHGGGGEAQAELVGKGSRAGVRAAFVDDGPGIADLELALTDGYTTGRGLGLGLSGARRLVDEFELDSKPGAGTRVTIVKWAR
ncbi:MAG TPA: anti-sigma regulatory factor [Micromonosporaceae bacterium]|nr:anti-sigma regulatory factor [Micromonosporaceae bacterium]